MLFRSVLEEVQVQQQDAHLGERHARHVQEEARFDQFHEDHDLVWAPGDEPVGDVSADAADSGHDWKEQSTWVSFRCSPFWSNLERGGFLTYGLYRYIIPKT